LYSSFVGCFVYTLLGSAKDITIGPVAIMSLLVASLASSPVQGDATYAIIVSLIGGCIQLFMGIFKLGMYVCVRARECVCMQCLNCQKIRGGG
jgi:sodium-independent sulfate anion transporter 11